MPNHFPFNFAASCYTLETPLTLDQVQHECEPHKDTQIPAGMLIIHSISTSIFCLGYSRGITPPCPPQNGRDDGRVHILVHSEAPYTLRSLPAPLLHLWAVADDDTLLVAVSRPVGQHSRHATDLVRVQRRIDLQPTHAMRSCRVVQG